MIFLLGLVVFTLVVFLLTAFTGAPYVPSQRKEIQQAFDELRPLGPDDVLLDIGSGDGVVLGEVASRGARAVGYELNFYLVWISRWRLRKYSDTVQVLFKNLWSAPFPDDVTLVYTFGESRDIAKMYRKVEQEATRLGRPLELISYGFTVPNVACTRQHRAHFLYQVVPLHLKEP